MTIEITASCTRVFNSLSIVSEAVNFGTVYLGGAFCICYFKEKKTFHLVLFSLFGLIAETWSGILADRARGHSIYALYFVLALVIGVALGYQLAQKQKSETRRSLENFQEPTPFF